jgi:hypothetical protein
LFFDIIYIKEGEINMRGFDISDNIQTGFENYILESNQEKAELMAIWFSSNNDINYFLNYFKEEIDNLTDTDRKELLNFIGCED